MLSISEELFLLALDEEKGNILPSVKRNLAYGLSGAALSELTLMGKVSSNEKHRLELIDASSTGDEFLDGAIREIQSSEKTRKWAYWVSQLSARPKKLRERTGERLVGKDVLYQEDRHFFRKIPYSEDGQPAVTSKFELKNKLRAMILSESEVDLHSLALLNAASASELLNLIFTEDEVPVAKRRIHEKVTRAALVYPAMQSIEEIQQAIAASLDDDDE